MSLDVGVKWNGNRACFIGQSSNAVAAPTAALTDPVPVYTEPGSGFIDSGAVFVPGRPAALGRRSPRAKRSLCAVAPGYRRHRTHAGWWPRDELLNSWRFDSLLEARVIVEDWRLDYNTNRPHTAHGELTPNEFALHWTTTHQPQAA